VCTSAHLTITSPIALILERVKPMRSLIIVIAGSLIATLSLPLTAAAATITSKVTGGDWDLAATWDLNRVPGANDDVVIRDGSTVFATGLKFVKSLTVVHPGGTLTIGFAGGYLIATKGDIFISGRVIQPDALSADGAITVTATGSVQSNPNEGFVMFALGNIVIEKGGGVTPFGSRIPAETAGTPTRIQSRAGDITVKGNVIGIPGGKGNLGQGGQPPTPGGKGGEVSIIVSKGHKIVVKEGPTIMGGAGGAAVEGGAAGALGKVKLLGGKEEITRDDIVGSSVEILGNGGIPNEVVGVLITSQGPGAVRATETDLTLATCPLMAIDLRGNTVAGIVSAARTAILEAETVFVDADQPNPVAAPHESDSNPRFTQLADLDGNGIADFCEEEIVNSLVTFSPTPSSFRTSLATGGLPPGVVGTFSFTARLVNKTTSPMLTALQVEVTTLTNRNLLLNADGGPGGVGARLTVPLGSTLAPGQFVDVPFVVGFTERRPFTFLVDVVGSKH
jgi:hypothetical protein